MTVDKKLDSKPKTVSKVPHPTKPFRSYPPSNLSSRINPKPDWKFWERTTEVRLWQAAFLSCDINPATEEYDDMCGCAFENPEVSKRLRSLIGHIDDRKYFSHSTVNNGNDTNLFGVRLPEFAAWCIHMGWNDIPPELAAFSAKATLAIEQPTSATKEETLPTKTNAPPSNVENETDTKKRERQIQAIEILAVKLNYNPKFLC